MKIDPSKKWKTATAKHSVTIISVDGPYPGFPVVGYVHGHDVPMLCHWSEQGGYPANTHLDLVEDREPREWELVVAKPENGLHKAGTIDGPATEELQGGDKDIPHEFWEIVRVREIIEP